MKIAVTTAKWEHIKRGVETWGKDTAFALKEKGVDVRFYKGSGENRPPFERALSSLKGYDARNQRLLKWMPPFAWHFGFGSSEQIEETTFAWSLIKEARKEKFDIIHTQDAHVAEALQFAYRIGLIKSKVILGHGTEEPFWFLKKFDYIQHLAPYHLDEAVQHCGARKGWFAIGNFIDVERFTPGKNPELRRELNIPENAFVVLSVAAIKSAHKRVDYLIKEVKRLIDQGNRDVYLVVAGSATRETDQIVQMGNDLLGDHVRFLINQSHDKMPHIHRMADVFALCSIKEMMPIALLEALATGKPCLINKYPVEEWMIGKGGESIDMAKDGVLAETLKKYLNPRYADEKSKDARQQAVQEFSKDIILNRYIDMYHKVLEA